MFLSTARILSAQNTSIFGPNVTIIDPTMSSTTINSTLNALNQEAQFSSNRYAVFFEPGTYSGVAAQVGYYESVAGLGQTPQGVAITGELYSTQVDSNGNVTTNFWRSLENLDITYSSTLLWGVSQGADYRRMLVNGGLELTNTSCGNASGGFIADSVITGNVNPCSQQQWFTRNSNLGSWSGGVWNMTFSGVQGAPIPNYPTNKYTVLPTTPVSREKAFIYMDGNGNYNVFVPSGQTNSLGATWYNNTPPGYSLPISDFFIATPSNSLADINNALAYGQNLILTPGIYQYSGSINVTNPNTVVLGLGFATLIPQAGTPAITVADVDGVQIAGLIIDAGPVNSNVLLQIGVQGAARVRHQSNPTSINDVYFRIGGAEAGSASVSLEIDSDDVILDNVWAWRADHGAGVAWAPNAANNYVANVANNGVVVNGDYVTALGLAVEHYQQSQVLWNGNSGETIFYQSELPYDVPSQAAWMNGAANGYASYAVSNQVTSHAAYGLGVYSYFNQGLPIVEDSAITLPNTLGVSATDAVSVFLNGSGGITATVNTAGTPVLKGTITSYVPFYQGVACTTTCPAPATNLNAYAIAPSQINLAWTASTTPGVTYSVFRGTTSGFTPSTANQLTSGAQGVSFADISVSPLTTYYYIIQAQSPEGSSTLSNVASATTTVNNGGTITTEVLEIDCGADPTIPSGWVSDRDFIGGSTSSKTHTGGVTLAPGDTATSSVYLNYRTVASGASSFSYAIPNLTAGSSYIVNLHFSDDAFSTAGSRQFNVAINGTPVLTNFDVAGTTGGEWRAIIESFYAVADPTGTITIVFSNGAHSNPFIDGVEIGTGSNAAFAVPAAPTGLTAGLYSGNQINLSWNSVSGSGINYEVFRGTTSGFAPGQTNLLTTTPSTSFTDLTAMPGVTYYYVVEANNAMWTSAPSIQQSVAVSAPTVNIAVPAAPTNLAASTVSGSQISVFWTGSATPNVTYELYRTTTPGTNPTTGTLVISTTATGFQDTGLISATSYYYTVVAVDSNGASQPSNLSSATTTGTAAATPTYTVAAGTYIQPPSVSINDATPGASIYYTTDGNTPTVNSNLYSGAITVSASETLQAIAVESGYFPSSVASAAYVITPPAATPTFSVAAGTYIPTQTVSILDATAGTTIYYTLDGSTPTTNSAVFSVPLTVSSNETIKAIASGNGYSASAVGSAAYVITPPAATPTFSVAAGTYIPTQTVSILDATAGTTIYYTLDGSTPTTNSAVFSVPLTVSSNETIKAIASGNGYSASAVGSAAYVITPPAATPTFSVAAGTYIPTQTVSILDATAGTTIYYTLDGSTPTTNSAVFSVPLTVSSNETIKAIASGNGYSASAVGSAAYVITPPAATPTFSVAAGTYIPTQTVSILDATAGTTIYYTLDGSTPTTNSAVFSVPLTVSSNETIKAIASGNGYSASAVGSAAYVITPPAATPTFGVAAGTYVEPLTVTIYDTTVGTTVYYTLDGTTPTTNSSVYSAPITLIATETVKAIASGNGYSASAVGSAAYSMLNPVPVVNSMSPAVAQAGGAAFTLTVNGSGYTANSVVYWGDSAIATVYVSPIKLTAQIPATSIAAAGGIGLWVVTPTPGGGTSNAMLFQVDTPATTGVTAPTLTSLAATVTAGQTASYPVTVPSGATALTATCLNLPLGASCAYSAASNAVTIATSSSTVKGTYQVTIVFSQTVAGAIAAWIPLPIFLLPLVLLIRKGRNQGLWKIAMFGMVLIVITVFSTGCGRTLSSQVTTSSAVTLTIQ